MSRPTQTTITHGQGNWDGTANDNFTKLFGAPLPVKEYADAASLPASGGGGLLDRCLAVTVSLPMLWISNGSTWLPTGISVAVHDTGALSGATYTWTAAFPAKVRRIGVAGRVTTAIGGASSTDVGNHGAAVPDMYADNVANTLGTTFADAATVDPGGWSATAQNVVLTANTGNFTSGAFRLYAFYIACFAPVAP